jgi:CRISPR/Cas system-associated endonuclease Cas1
MGFRTVVVKSRCKLEYSLNYLICRSDGEKKICLDEINTVIVQNTAVALTASLLSALTEKGIKVIFCDAKSNPQSELIPYYCSYNCYEKILLQQSWDKPTKDSLWKLITKEKISNQAKNLESDFFVV